jgi:hypothetical protein
MKMICALDAMLFLSSQAEFAAPANATGKADSHKATELNVIRATRAYSDNTSNTFMTSNMRKFDLCYRSPIRFHSRS